MSGWGATFQDAWDGATDAARDGVRAGMESARAAAAAVGRASEIALQGAKNVAEFGARAVDEAAGIAKKSATSVAKAAYRAATQTFSSSGPPRAIQTCPATPDGKKDRLQRRQKAIEKGRRDPNPAARRAAERLSRNNDAVELARLSDNAYAQYPGPGFAYPKPGQVPVPPGWSVVPKEELAAKGVNVKDLEDARAVVYRTPADWPGGQKTVLSFRGTADVDDAVVDHDQAMGLPTTQYAAAMRAGDSISQGFGPSVQVTGHSLGGGKAQAAGVAGGLKGTMFNAAGLHPGTTANIARKGGEEFEQYRTSGDPLTGAQNSPLTQAAIVAVAAGATQVVGPAAMQGMSPEMAAHAEKAFMVVPRAIKNLILHGDFMPPAIGTVREVPAIDDDGNEVPAVNLMGQHSIGSVVNGLEREKEADLAVLTG